MSQHIIQILSVTNGFHNELSSIDKDSSDVSKEHSNERPEREGL